MEYYKGTYINSVDDCVEVIRDNTDNDLASAIGNVLSDAVYEAEDNVYENIFNELSEAQKKISKLLVNKVSPDILQEVLDIASCGFGYSHNDGCLLQLNLF